MEMKKLSIYFFPNWHDEQNKLLSLENTTSSDNLAICCIIGNDGWPKRICHNLLEDKLELKRESDDDNDSTEWKTLEVGMCVAWISRR